MDCYLLAFARLESNSIEAHERPQCKLRAGRRIGRRSQIDLGYLVAVDFAHILDRKANGQSAIGCRCRLKIGIFEFGIGQAVTEWEQRLDVLLIEPTIPYENSLRKRDHVRMVRTALRMCGVVRNVLIE